jgi:NhaP-type Na+/H+ or K+/H+ antiporter
MDISFGEALLIIGLLLAVAAALSGVMRGTVLSISVLAVTAGIGLAAADVISVDAEDPGVIEVVELALILTLFSDGMFVERELLGRHWGPPARALALAMPATMGLLALGAYLLFPDLSWAEAFLLAAVLSPTDPVVTSTVVTAQRVFLVLATPGGDAGQEAVELLGEAGVGAVIGVALGLLGGRLHNRLPGGGITARYEGIYAIGFGLTAFGLADVTFGNGLIAAFVAGIVLGAAERDVPDSFIAFSENASSVFQVVTFFLFGAVIVAIGYERSILPLLGFIAFALLVARPVAVRVALAGTKLPYSQKSFIAWFGPKGVASMLFALLVLDAQVAEGSLVFDVAAFVILSSILAHGLTDTVGARWIERRMEVEKGEAADEAVPGRMLG